MTLLTALTAVTTKAEPLVVVNPGFEDITGESPVNEFTFGPLPGWDLYDPDGVTNGGVGPTYFLGSLTPFEPDPIGAPGVYAFFPDGAPEGERVGIAFSFFGSGGAGAWGFVQVLGDVLEPDTTYTLRVQVGNIDSGTSLGNTYFPLEGFPGYRVQLLAGADQPDGGFVIAQDDGTLSSSILDGEWAESVVTLTTGSDHPQLGETLGIRLVNLNVVDPLYPSSDLEVDFDDVRIDASPAMATVPGILPPAVPLLLLTMIGASGFGTRFRREAV